MQTSTRFGISYPVAARTDPADVAVHIGNVVTGLEKAVRYDSGTLAARPISSVGTPGITGRHYFATDESQMYFDYGTGWIGIIVQNQKLISTLNASAASNAYQSYMTGDTQPRFVINADGKHQWGAGGASALDPLATLYRSGAGMLSTDGTMIVNGSLYVATTAHAIWVQNIQAAFSAFLVKASADTQQRFRMLGDGMHQWGSGAVVEDVNLYRGGVDILATDDRFLVAGAQSVGNPFGLQIGPLNSLVMHYQGYVGAAAYGYIGHNNWLGSDLAYRFDATHASFGSRGILFNYSGAASGIQFYADNAAATAGATFTPTLRMVVRNDGDVLIANRLLLGAAGDANLYRAAAGNLKTDGSFTAGQSMIVDTTNAGNAVYFGSLLDTKLYRSAAALLKTDGSLVSAAQIHSFHTLAGSILLTTDTGVGTGKPYIWLGSALDTNLYRNLAGQLKTDASFSAIQLSANPVGAGVSYGFVWAPAVYNAQSRMFTAVRVLGDAQPNFVIDADGKLNWAAGGSAAIDVSFGRSRNSVLTLIGTLALGGVSGGGDGTKGIVFDNATTLPGVIDNNGGILFVQNGILYFRAGGNIRTVNLT